MPALFTNNASTTLASSILSTDLTLTVVAGAGATFPSPTGAQYFYVTLVETGGALEIVKVTSRSTDTFTIVRAQDGTTALGFTAGALIELRAVAAALNNFRQADVALTSGSAVLYGDGSGGFSNVTVGTGLSFVAGTLSSTGVLLSAANTWAAVQTFGKAIRETKTALGANDIDQTLGNYFSKTISGITTLTVSNTPATGTASSFILELTNGGSATVNWWTGVKWANGVSPTLTAAGVDILGFYTYDGGTTWRGLVLSRDSR